MRIIEKFTIQIEKENYLFIVINTYIVTVLINTISSCQITKITYGIKKNIADEERNEAVSRVAFRQLKNIAFYEPRF